jgi:hypothetical protein
MLEEQKGLKGENLRGRKPQERIDSYGRRKEAIASTAAQGEQSSGVELGEQERGH